MILALTAVELRSNSTHWAQLGLNSDLLPPSGAEEGAAGERERETEGGGWVFTGKVSCRELADKTHYLLG